MRIRLVLFFLGPAVLALVAGSSFAACRSTLPSEPSERPELVPCRVDSTILGAPRPLPAWVEGAVVYGVVPALFGAEHPLRAVTEQLEDLAELGVDALWLPPVLATDDPSAISYSVTDYFALRPDLGTREDLEALIQASKDHGMRVLLDFVPNHTSRAHPYFLDGEARGSASAFWDYYERDPEGRATHYFDWEHLPNLNYSNRAVQGMMLDAFAYWLSSYHVDGFRVDAAWGVQKRCPGFWPLLTREMKASRPDSLLIAEASARDGDFVASGFDAAYDWTEKLGEWAFQGVFEETEKIGPRLAHALRPGATPPERVLRFLNNNDTGARFVTRYGPARTRVAATLLLTLPGIPVVYTGDEVGAEFEPYGDPSPLDWRDPHGLRPLYRALADLRERLPALRAGDFELVPVHPSESTFAFVRRKDGAVPALVVLNFGDAARLELTPAIGADAPRQPGSGGAYCDVLTGTSRTLGTTANGHLALDVRATEPLILMPTGPGGPPCSAAQDLLSSRARRPHP